MPSTTHGTAFSLGQFAELNAGITRALPKALAGLDPKSLLPAVQQRGEELEKVLSGALQTFLANGQTQAAPAATTPVPEPVPTLDPTMTAFSVAVDFGLTVEKAIKKGKYGWVNDNNITGRNFAHDRKAGKADLTVELVHFDRPIESGDAVAELDKLGLRPATLMELAALGAQHPELQRQFPIVALGSPWVHPGGNRRVPLLSRRGSERVLFLLWWSGSWRAGYRFAAVRKPADEAGK